MFATRKRPGCESDISGACGFTFLLGAFLAGAVFTTRFTIPSGVFSMMVTTPG